MDEEQPNLRNLAQVEDGCHGFPDHQVNMLPEPSPSPHAEASFGATVGPRPPMVKVTNLTTQLAPIHASANPVGVQTNPTHEAQHLTLAVPTSRRGSTFSGDGVRASPRRPSLGSHDQHDQRRPSFSKRDFIPPKPQMEARGGVFCDLDSMKDKLKQNMSKPQYDVSDYYVKAGLFQHIATHKIFEALTLSVIGLNALWISVDTDYNKSVTLLGAQPHFQIMEHFFCFYFSFEWFCRYMSFKRKRDGCKDAWFVFDSIMVGMMVAETWIMTIVLLATGAGGSGGMGNASILRLARLLRLSRMMRMARLLHAMPELLILIKGMAAAMRSVFFTLLLLGVLIYIFGIMFKQLTDGTAAGHIHFDSVPMAMHTLLLYGALMDDIGRVVTDLGDENYFYAFVFYIFVLLAALTMMNMLIGVLCEVVSAVATTEREQLAVNYVKEKLQMVMKETGLDEDGDGELSKKEFLKIIDIPEAAHTLQEVGIDVVGLVDLSDFIFGDASLGQEEHPLSFEEFMRMVLSLRGTNTATVKDIVDLRKFVAKENKILEDKLEMALANKRASSRDSEAKATKSISNCKCERRQSQTSTCGNGYTALVDESKSQLCNNEMQLETASSVVQERDEAHEQLWLKAGKLEELLLAGQAELSAFKESMRVAPAGSEHLWRYYWDGQAGSLSNVPTNVNLINLSTPGSSTNVAGRLPSLSLDLQVQLATLEHALFASVQGLHFLRQRLGAASLTHSAAPQRIRPNPPLPPPPPPPPPLQDDAESSAVDLY